MIWEAEQPLSNSAAIAIAAAIVRFIVVLSETEPWVSVHRNGGSQTFARRGLS
jgi:hypothetical protein